jgi:hypothetical protein
MHWSILENPLKNGSHRPSDSWNGNHKSVCNFRKAHKIEMKSISNIGLHWLFVLLLTTMNKESCWLYENIKKFRTVHRIEHLNTFQNYQPVIKKECSELYRFPIFYFLQSPVQISPFTLELHRETFA